MRLLSFVFATVAAMLLLAGCVSHLSQQECMVTNWYQVGFGDGTAGHQQRNLQGAIQDCAKFHLTVNQSAYRQGYFAGMKQFCTPTYDMGVSDGSGGRTMTSIASRQPVCQQAGVTLITTKYKQGYIKGLSRFCTYDDGFNIGVQGHPMPQVCPAQYRRRFAEGWNRGIRKFCAQPAVGFNLGKTGAPYPAACTPARYMTFRSEYERGVVIFNRVGAVQGRIDGVSRDINHLVSKHDLRQGYGGRYHLGKKKDAKAKTALRRVNEMVRQRQRLSDELFQARSMG